MIYCRRSLWFLVGLLIAATINFAYAAFPAIPPGGNLFPHPQAGFASVPYPGKTTACTASMNAVFWDSSIISGYSVWSHYTSGQHHPVMENSVSQGACDSTPEVDFVATKNLACPVGSSYVNPAQCASTAYTCPSNSTMSGSGAGATCTCATGYHEVGSTCVVDPTCPPIDSQVSGYIAKNLNPAIVCFGVCEAVVVSAHNQAAVAGVQVIAGTWAYTGNDSCSGPPVATAGAVTPSICPANTCPGEVSGVFTCLPCSDAAPDESWKKTKDEKVNADGSTTKTETTEKTVCNGDTCTTEKSTKKTETPSGGGGGSTENTSEKKEQTQEDFCAANPNSDKCKKEGAGTGAAITGLYEAESATFQGTYDAFKSDVAAAPLIAATSGFFNVSAGAGTCPTWTWNAGDWGTYTIDIFCEPTLIGIFEVVGNIVLLGAVLAAIFIALF